MLIVILKWLQNIYRKVITSIAFLPAVIALSFFVLSYLMIQLDLSSAGKDIKLNYDWLSLKDASTARSICTTIAGGLISLTVFSFSMVMILLGQAAAQMSNRILGRLISNTFQQVVLGFYIGTTVYALFLLSAIRDIDTGVHVPALSTYLLIAFTVVDIFLFIYFLHYITQSVKFETIIDRIFMDTSDALKESCKLKEAPGTVELPEGETKIGAHKSGLFQGFQKAELASLCKHKDIVVSFLYPVGTFLIAGTPLLRVNRSMDISGEFLEKLSLTIEIQKGEDISTSYYYGFKQLLEIAVKALSPGINDPGTAIIALQALGNLMAYRAANFPETRIDDDDGRVRIFIKERTFDEIFADCILPIWDYGKSDRLLQNEMIHVLTMLQMTGDRLEISGLIKEARSALNGSGKLRA